MTRLAVFASGGGSNAECIFNHFSQISDIEVVVLICNRPDAFVLQRASTAEVSSEVVNRTQFADEAYMLNLMQQYQVDFIALAGFLWLIPSFLVRSFPKHILNIHPALLPKYGGKGMYGMHVHRAVKTNREAYSGMTIHYVSEVYDEGEIVFQATCEIAPLDTPEMIQTKVLRLEHLHFARVIEAVIRGVEPAVPGQTDD